MVFTCQVITGDAIGIGGSGGNRTKAGVRILSGNLVLGKNINSIKFYIKNPSNCSCTGDINLAIYNGGVNQNVNGSTYDSDALTASFQLITFTMDPRTILLNDDIVLEGGTVSDANQVQLSANGSPTESDQTKVQVMSGAWSTVSGNTYWCWSEFTASPTLLPPPPIVLGGL